MIEELLEAEKAQEEWRLQTISEEEKDLRKSKLAAKEALVDDLMCSDLSANQILAQHAKQTALIQQKHNTIPKPPPKLATFSTGIKVSSSSGMFLPVPKSTDEQPYVYKQLTLQMDGPSLPDPSELDSKGYLAHVRSFDLSEKSGGFMAIYPCYRALQEAFCGLYYDPNERSSASNSLVKDEPEETSNFT